MAFGIRYAVSAVLRCFVLLKKGDFWGLLSLNKLFSEKYMIAREDAVRVGLATGGFGAIYNLVTSLAERYMDRQALNGKQHFVGGLLGGLTMLFLEKDSRRTLSLQVLGRVLECVYNALKSRGWWHFWGSNWNHGDTLLFCLASAQIMYAYVMRPETLDDSYYKFIVKSGPIDEVVLQQVRNNNRGRPLDVNRIVEYVTRRNPNADRAGLASEVLEKLTVIPCSVLHPHNESCVMNALEVLRLSFKKILPIYATLTFVPLLLLKFGSFIKHPLARIWTATLSTIQSSLFLGTFVMVYMSVVCLQRKVVSEDFRFTYWLSGFIASLSLLIEKKSRRSELALYALPRGIDSLYMLLLDRKWMASLPQGELILFCISMGSIMYFYDNESHTMSPFLKNILDWVIGRRHQKSVPKEREQDKEHLKK
uniref:Transmembrane protein 135 N-terminal domain-containing protein n=1 Tax=Arcella intermedia TaxID=1963864 RepID=A0A6B2L4Z8_9EUKA